MLPACVLYKTANFKRGYDWDCLKVRQFSDYIRAGVFISVGRMFQHVSGLLIIAVHNRKKYSSG